MSLSDLYHHWGFYERSDAFKPPQPSKPCRHCGKQTLRLKAGRHTLWLCPDASAIHEPDQPSWPRPTPD